MRHRWLLLLGGIGLALLLGGQFSDAEASGNQKVYLVLTFKNISRNASYDWMSEGLSELMRIKLDRLNDVTVVRRDSTDLQGQELPLDRSSGRVDIAALKTTSRSLGADYVVVGLYSVIKNIVRVNVKYLSMDQDDLVNAAITTGKRENLLDTMTQVSQQLVSRINPTTSSRDLGRLDLRPVKDYDGLEALGGALLQWYGPNKDLEGALELLAPLLEASNPYPSYYQGRLYFEAKKYDQAAQAMKAAIKANRSFAPAYFELGNIYNLQRKNSDAVRNYKSALKNDPDIIEARFELGKLYLEEKKAALAVKEFARLVKTSPENPHYHNYIARAHLLGGNVPKAIEELEKFLAKSNKSQNAHFNLGTYLYKSGDTEKAIAEFQKALNYDLQGADANILLADAYYEKGEFAKALKSYQLSLAMDPGNKQLLVKYARTLSKLGTTAEAISVLLGAIKDKPSIPIFYLLLAENYQKTAAFNKATPVLEQAAKLLGADARVEQLMARNKLALKQLPAAQKHYRAAIKLAPNQHSNYFELSDLLIEQGNFDAAAALLAKLSALLPQDRRINYRIARIEQQLGDLPRALVEITKALVADRKNAHKILIMAEIQFALELWDDCNQSLKRLFRVDSQNKAGHKLQAKLGEILANIEVEPAAFAAPLVEQDGQPVAVDPVVSVVVAEQAPDSVVNIEQPLPPVAEIDEAKVIDFNDSGIRFTRRHKYLAAVTAFQNALKEDSYNAIVICNLAYVYGRLGDWPAAEKQLRLAATLAPKDPVVDLLLGNMYFAGNLNKAAIASYTAALRKAPNVAKIHNLLGNVYNAENNAAKGLAEYQKALFKQNQGASELKMVRGVYLESVAVVVEPQPGTTPAQSDPKNLSWRTLMANDRFAEAVAVITLALKEAPDDQGLLVALARSQAAQGEYDAAISAAGKLLKTDRKNKNYQTLWADYNLAAGNPYKAYKSYKKILRKHPGDSIVLAKSGVADIRRGKEKKGFKTLLAAVEKKTSYIPAYLMLADRYMESDDLKSAVAILRPIVQKYPKQVDIRRKLAELYLEQDKLDMATKELLFVVKARPNDPEAHFQISELYAAQSDWDAAERHLIMTNKLQNDVSRYHFRLGQVYYFNDKVNMALKELVMAVELDHKNLAARVMVGDIFAATSRWEQALEEYLVVSRKGLKAASLYVKIGSAYDELGKLSEANKFYQKAVKLAPKIANYQYRLARIFIKQNKEQRAIAPLTAVIKLSPDQAASYLERGWCNYVVGKVEPAKEDYLQAIQLDAKNPVVRFNLGLLYVSIGNNELAHKEYSAATGMLLGADKILLLRSQQDLEGLVSSQVEPKLAALILEKYFQ